MLASEKNLATPSTGDSGVYDIDFSMYPCGPDATKKITYFCGMMADTLGSKHDFLLGEWFPSHLRVPALSFGGLRNGIRHC